MYYYICVTNVTVTLHCSSEISNKHSLTCSDARSKKVSPL